MKTKHMDFVQLTFVLKTNTAMLNQLLNIRLRETFFLASKILNNPLHIHSNQFSIIYF